MSNSRPGRVFSIRVALVVAGLWLAVTGPAFAQVGALVSPGPLSHGHAKLEGIANCQQCHEPGRRIAAAKCLACHKSIAGRIAARKGVHRAVTGACDDCHVEHAGVGADLRRLDRQRFNHAADAGFPLEGLHAPLAKDCAKCHKARSFLDVRPECASCHKDVHKGALGPACATCHAVTVPFADAGRHFDHSTAKFALTGAHRTVPCARCHVNKVFTGLKFAACTDCHREPHRQAFGADCASCHVTDTWTTRKVDHGRTSFPLKGAHATARCPACHVKPAVQVRLRAARCGDCHTDIHRGQFKKDCGACHTERTFRKAPFDHAATARFPLTGAHAPLACARCHKGASAAGARTVGARATASVVFTGLSAACASCHEDVHKGATGRTCETCHSTVTFRSVKSYVHPAALLPFMVGRHAAADCRACHAPRAGAPAVKAAIGSWTFKRLGATCTTCHADPHAGEFGATCDRCHAIEETGFAATRFSHAGSSFPLTGRHQAVRCAQCHTPHAAAVVRPAKAAVARPSPARDESGRVLRFKGAGTDCASCHKDVHLGQLGRQCQTCHSAEGFAIPKYAHKQIPRGFFTGSHGALACRACHKSQTAAFPAGHGTAVRFIGLGPGCASCHAAQDAHRGALGAVCERCHTPEQWPSASRAFHKAGQFPLEGRHLTVPCASCHVNGVVTGTPTACYDCHWIRRRDDVYETRLGSQCEMCHRPISWTATRWSHVAQTGFPLNASHQSLRCDSCHATRRFTGGGVSCANCHLDAYQRTANPSHAAGGFPLTCEVCHQPAHVSWTQAVFNHGAFPLVGIHATQACSSCHKNNVYKGTPRDCFGCHSADYQKTTSPNHASAGFPTTCDRCHQATASAWANGSFNHASTFPLVGVHATQACTACHKNNVYKGTPRDCFGCHSADYQKTTSPNHATAGFPTTCDQCHQATAPAWAGGSFNHASAFSLVGVHATQACTACHKNNVYKGTPRDCFGCHSADYQRTTNPSHAAAGFPTACDQCHQATASTWTSSLDHNQFFPLLGRHLQQACSACHQNNVYKGTSTACVACHLASYQQTTNPNHAGAGFPTTCDVCHQASDTAWTLGRFTHTWFPITSGNHAGRACSACHTTASAYTVFSCVTGCHARTSADSNHRQVTAYRYDSVACYACHPSGRAGSPRP